ncbi:MAG: threonine/serine exporter family protein [Clostridium sp.]|nr:threonine/serine exporter family protein [Clostridium sp.]
MILGSLYALLASLGFGVIFNIRGRNLFFASLGGSIGWFFYLLSLEYYPSKVFALFVGSLAISIYSEVMARVLKTPVTTFMICAMIPLVPGAGMYYTMLESIQGNIDKSLTLGLQTIGGAGAIAVATVLVASTTKVIVTLKQGKIKGSK